MLELVPPPAPAPARTRLPAFFSRTVVRALVPYAAAVGSAAVAAAVRYLLDPVLGDHHPFVLFLAAAFAAARVGGWRAGVLALGLGLVAADLLFIRPRGVFGGNPTGQHVGLVVYAAVGGTVVWLVEALRRARDDLSRRVDLGTTELALSESRVRRLAALFESSADAVVVVGLDGKVTDWNPAAEQLFGYTAAEMLGTPGSTHVPPDRLGELAALQTRALAGERVEAHDTVRVRKDGVQVEVSMTVGPVRDSAGGVVGAARIVRDVTARRRAEAEARAARADAERALARVRAIVSSMVDGVIVADPDLNLIDWNPAALRMHGYRTIAEIGPTAADLATGLILAAADGTPLPPDEWPLARVLRGESVTGLEILARRPDVGVDLVVSVSGAPVRGPGGRVELGVLTLHDVTARRQLEEQYRQSQKMEAVGRLAGGIAHDFNNLLTVITGYTELILHALPPDDPNHETMTEIDRAADRAAGLTRQLLAFGRKQVLAPRLLDLNAVVDGTAGMLRRLIGEDVRLATDLDPAAGAVFADAGQIEQVLMNLAVNARDAMPTGGTLTIETAAADGDAEDPPGDRRVLLTVSDTGCGMSADVRARAFEPFFTTKELGKGSGLGLATVFGIVTQSGGRVEIDSEVGAGTTVRVSLPAAGPRQTGVSAAAPAAARPGRETVLLVEDEEAVRGLAARALRSAGYAVTEAAGADDGVRAAAGIGRPVDLILTDVVMPGGGGRSLVERLAAGGCQARVLYMSGYTDDAVVRHGVAHADVEFLQKPFAVGTLLRTVRRVLDGTADRPPVIAM